MDPARSHRSRRPRRHAPGTAAGTLLIDPNAPKSAVTVMAYDGDEFVEGRVHDLASLTGYLKRWKVTWISVQGLGDEHVVSVLGDLLGIHRLALEDVVSTHQRSKVEEYDSRVFLVARMLAPGPDLQTEQVSLFLGPGFVLSFEERPGDAFDPIRRRIREDKGRLRAEGADYLFYCLLDAIVDGYFPCLDDFAEYLEALEDEVVARPNSEMLSLIHTAKRDLLTIRRCVSPLREAVNALLRDTDERLGQTTRLYLRDCYDHTVQILDLVDTQREIAAGLLDVYLSSVSNRMNEVMKVLTVIATVFIPLTFVAGLYGMNFDYGASPLNMPELHWRFGYPTLLLAMLGLALFELGAFWRLGWLSGADRRRRRRHPLRFWRNSGGPPSA